MKSIAVIDCSVKEQAFHCFNNIVDRFSLPFTFHAPALHHFETLNKIQSPAGYILFGSAANVQDNLPWIDELKKFLAIELNKNIPVFGLCFGHQLLAKMHGGTVDFINEKQSLTSGLREFAFKRDFHGYKKDSKYSLLVTHKQEVKTIGKDTIHLGYSPECQFEALAHKTLPWVSFQGHPEGSRHFIKRTIETKLSDEEISKGQRDGLKLIEIYINLLV